MAKLKTKYTVIFILTFFVQTVFGQIYQFKQYSIEEGLSHPFAYTINEDKDGFIWIGTGEGLCKFDGFNFTVSRTDDTLTNGYVTSSFLDSEGILWFGHNSGQVTYYDGKQIKLLDLGEGINSSITDFCSDENGNVYISTQNNGIVQVSKDFKVEKYVEPFSGTLIYSIAYAGEKSFLIGTGDGLSLYHFKSKRFELVYSFKELEYISVQTIDFGQTTGAFWLGTEDSGFFLLLNKGENFDNYEIQNIGEKYSIGFENVQSVLEDSDGVLWISTFGKGVYKLIPDLNSKFVYKNTIHFSTENGLPNNFVKQVFRDWEGNNWIATYGNGIAFSIDDAFTNHYQNISALNGNVLSIAESESTLYLGGENAIAAIDKITNNAVIIDQKNGLPKDKMGSLYLDLHKNLWIGTSENGIYQLNTKTNKANLFYKSNNSLGNNINSITGNNNTVWVSSKNGVLVFDLTTGKSQLYNTQQGLPHNDIKSVFIDSNNTPWIATKNTGIISLDGESEYSIIGNALEFTSITQDSEGHLWASTYGDGVFKFEDDTLLYFSTDIGLKSNYCYSIIADNSGRIWIGHRLGMSSIDIKTGEIKVYGKEMGISGDVNYNSVLKQKTGVILTGTTNGLIRFDSSKEKKSKFAPKLNISKMAFSDQPVDYRNPVVLPYKIYKLNIEFVGLSFSNPAGVKYQYMLDGYDLEWSNLTSDRDVYYPRIEDGKYTFMLKACNSDGNCVENALEIEISIRPPIWKRWWFILLSIAIGLGSIYWYIKYRERKHKALQEYLETELAARTKEVVSQKNILEIKNRDITDSINYAQRIQQSILPSITSITDNFSDAFVYFQPRDIVSGDFYWYEKVNDDKFLIVCADSTGHGVPGAFMSMIGTTLIKDICMRKDINSPSLILENLDTELQNTLNQNIDAERANDGMDIIVCEIDVNTLYMRFASAMRPLILYKDGELQYVKGSKASIGGDPKDEKRFENIGFQLKKGDIVYMFSDGYPDQFGGPRGKKFKMDRVKNMLADVCQSSMDEQSKCVEKTFDQWRGKLQQVDDVLFMGVRL